jgi:hypothetical protein
VADHERGLVNFDEPSETRHFEKRFELYRVGPAILGRATYEPGWRWSQHVGPRLAQRPVRSSTSGSCSAGRRSPGWMTCAECLIKAGDFFYIPPGHDSWVVGDEPYVSLHISGAVTSSITPM